MPMDTQERKHGGGGARQGPDKRGNMREGRRGDEME
jgi:hypothetical protein